MVFSRICKASPSALERLRLRSVFLCHPNNPTGTVLNPAGMDRLVRRYPAVLFVVDEAYLPFATDCRSALDLGAANVLVLRSMTKDFGLAGLRLGYAAGPEPLIEGLRRVQPPWSVNALAQAAGVAALADSEHRTRSLTQLAEAKTALVAGLTQLVSLPCRRRCRSSWSALAMVPRSGGNS